MIVEQILTAVIVGAAALYLVERLFGVAERLGLRGRKPAAPVQLGARLQRGLRNAKRAR